MGANVEWHIWKEVERHGYPGNECSCGLTWDWKDQGCENKNPNFFSDSGFWIIWRAAKKSDRWQEFSQISLRPPWDRHPSRLTCYYIDGVIDANIIDPDIFAWEFAKFLGMKEE